MTAEERIKEIVPDRMALIPVLGIIVFLLITGCSVPTDSGNPVNTTYQNAEQNISEVTPVQPRCASPAGTAVPYIIINPVGDHFIGDSFEINGTTNLGTDAKISFKLSEPMRLDTAPGPDVTDTPYYEYSGTRGNASVRPGICGTNFWSYSVDLSGYHEHRYTVNVHDESNQMIKNSTQFMVTKIKSASDDL